jgi:hypothetical protein
MEGGFPDAEVYLAPRIKEQARGHVAFEGLLLGPHVANRGTLTSPRCRSWAAT